MARIFSNTKEDPDTIGSNATMDSTHTSSTAQTIIGPTVKLEGVFNSNDHILIEGTVNGTVTTTNDLTIGKDATLEADLTAANMHISGEVHGQLTCAGTIELLSTARVHGNIETSVISVETGAVINGQCITRSDGSASGAKSSGANTKEKPTDSEE